ncbi:PREDICTED: integrin alpha-3-like [Wasmannia auropunctata]|uniref:integrin alpha-3-like n=1 Tax=Wasmannia auropunctata TaxID=64793 RepID=UPI0005F05C2B|nr:PREDICTED: integrin alpha-3-like [Wasmannia auropunctata]
MKSILLFNLLIVSVLIAYNIDTNYPILYPNSATNADQYLHTKFERSYFGYSVLLHRDLQKNISWLFIGAPRGNYTTRSRFRLLNEPGVAYRCSLPGSCVEITPTFVEDEELDIPQIEMHAYVKKKHSWFGSAMSIERNSGFLTICAPRTILSIISNSKIYVETLHGMCYSNNMSTTTLKSEISEIRNFATILQGAKEDALFGYAVAVGDVDRDGFSDIIVGAPWEESGAIYVYNGDASLKDKVKPAMSQRITMQSPRPNFPAKGVDIQTFGFSIAEPIDIDNNGYADIAIGAYKSGHTIVLRSKPVVKTNLTVYTVPSTLQRNVSNFLIEACVEYHNYDAANTHAFKVSLVIDKKYKRTKETSLEVYSTDPPVHSCVNATITLSDNIQYFIEPITIYASHDFAYNTSAPEFCKTCPVESRSGKSKSAQVLLPFEIECGDDRVCNSNINATVKLWGIGENNTWIIGSNDITLETRLRNYAEPAYLTTIAFNFPKEIVLRSILPFCEENTDGDILLVICDVGNPFGTDEQKVVKLDLDMRQLIDGSLHGQVLEFFTEIRTRSTNHGTNMIKSSLTLQSEAFLQLNGKAIEKSYYLSNLDSDRSNIIFQHVYQILKFGATPIEEARLVVNLPTAIDDSDSLVLLYKPRIYISGKYYDCLSYGIDLMDTEQGGLPGETTSDISDLYNLNYNNETLQNTTHDMFKRSVDKYISFSGRILQTLYNIRMARTEDSNGNLTVRERDIVYVNCSTYGVNCSAMYCDLNALRTQQDVGKLVIRLILNTTRLKDNFKLSNEMKIVKFSTDAYVQIAKPANRTLGINARHDANVTTEFHSTAKTQKLQLWVVLVSVSLGLILLFIVVIILNMVGFFKRTTKEKLFALKSDEITEDAEKSTSE